MELAGEVFEFSGFREAAAGEFCPAGSFDESTAVNAGPDESDCVGGL
jgi:hypothetical protein